MDIVAELTQCQNILYKGFTTVDESGIEWLNGFCGDFAKFCNKLHKFLVFDCNQKTVVIETCFLCISQVICCVKYLEKTINIEKTEGTVLSSSRQYFLDRILWCFAHLKSTLNSAGDDVILSSLEDSNFVTSMDTLVELIEPYSGYKKEEVINVAQFNAQAVFDRLKIRTAVDLLISQTLALANVALDGDKVALMAICQKVLRECIEFEETCSLEQERHTHNDQQRQFKATVFENSLYQLEDHVNESLLRLVFQVMIDCSQHSVDRLRGLIKVNAGDELDSEIADFDVNVDRILQIGVFAMALSTDVRAKTTVRSCLASLESLDSSLIPSLYTKDDFHSTLLEDHYLSEVRKFKSAIQNIIDTQAFCKCFDEILNNAIANLQKQFDKHVVSIILEKGKILNEHFHINSAELLKTNEGNRTKECYEKFNLMMNECLAILVCADQVDNDRILKRLKILRSTVKKLTEVIGEQADVIDGVITGASILDQTKRSARRQVDFSLESFGISPSITCILYGKNGRNKTMTDSMKAGCSQLSSEMNCSDSKDKSKCSMPSTKNSTNFRSPNLRRRASLRTQMFKRQKSNEVQTVWATFNDQSTNLHITDILDQITNLSSTFTR